jgi:hypothetical protein
MADRIFRFFAVSGSKFLIAEPGLEALQREHEVEE